MNEWDKQLVEILKKYTDGITDGVREAVKEVALETVPEVKAESPVKSYGKKKGSYKKGWVAGERDNSTATRMLYSVYNKTDYQLTHLLEKGHKLIGRNGRVIGWVAPREHIAPVNKEAHDKLIKRIEDVIKKG